MDSPGIVRDRRAGFSIFELVVVIAVISIIAAMSIPNMMRSISQNRLGAAASGLSGALTTARYQAVSSGCPMEIIVSNGTYQRTSTGTVLTAGVINCNITAGVPQFAAMGSTVNVPGCPPNTGPCIIPYASSEVVLSSSNPGPVNFVMWPSGIVTSTLSGPPYPLALTLTTSSTAIKTINVSGAGNVSVK